MESKPNASRLNFRRAFVIDDDVSVVQFVSETLASHDFSTESFATAKPALAALGSDHPAIIFLDVALLHSDAIDVLVGLGEEEYCGIVVLMSAGRPQLIEAVQRLGVRHGVKLAPPLSKPIERENIVHAVAGMKSAIDAPQPRRMSAKG
jgi:FixJ family two-component response regulator